MQYNPDFSRHSPHARSPASENPQPASRHSQSETALLRRIQATWDTCARTCPDLANPSHRHEAERLVGEILRETGAWGSDGLSGILHRGAVDIVSHQPKSTLNITARALDVLGRIALIRGKSDEATQFFKCAVGVSAAPREVIGSLVDDTKLALTRASDQDAERMKVFALEALCRHLETGPRISGERIESSLIKGKPLQREQAQWALLQTAEFANSLGVTAVLKSGVTPKEHGYFELTCRCGRNSLRLFSLPTDLIEAYKLATGPAAFDPAPLGISELGRKQLTRTIYLAADAYRHLGSPAAAYAGLTVSDWIFPSIPDARVTRSALLDAHPGLNSRVEDELTHLISPQSPSPPPLDLAPRIENPASRSTGPASPGAQGNWTSNVAATVDWGVMRLGPEAMLGWDLDRTAREKLLDARMAVGEQGQSLLPDQRLQDFAHDLAVLAQLPATHLSSYQKLVRASVEDASVQDSERFVDLLQMEATLALYSRLPEAHTPLRSEADRLKSVCERTARILHKPLGLGPVHGPVLKVFQVILDWRISQLKKRH